MQTLTKIIATKTDLSPDVITNIISLIEQGNTIPFIARYRKEATGGASDSQLREFADIYDYQQKLATKKDDILRLITEKEALTPELQAAITAAQTLAALEDIYRPFKDKKHTRATKAIAKGLQPLADLLLACQVSLHVFEDKAAAYINDTGDEKTSIGSAQEAIQGAQDIIAEIIADDPQLRQTITQAAARRIELMTKPTKQFESNGVYATYQDYRKAISHMPSHAYLAICRAEKEKQLRVSLNFNLEHSIRVARDIFVARNASDLRELLLTAITDGIKRLLHPSLERERRAAKKARADQAAIAIFGHNIQELLLSSPVRNKVIMGFDPAYRTGCKIAVINETGKFLDTAIIYPTKPQQKTAVATQVMLALIKKHNIGLICIGNGTASRESEQFVAQLIQEYKLDTKYLIVSEAGASVYSASKLADQEYPDLDVTVRGAINIAQRIQDPLAAYVKIDPKSLGVGQYQHDVDQKLLKQKLDEHIEDAVNRVGVDINTASRALLQHIAGLSTTMAKNIVSHRETHGPFTTRSQIKKVKGIGPKAFEQCAGFLRINEAAEPLDSTGIHPESYALTYQLLADQESIDKKSLVLPHTFSVAPDLPALATYYDCGLATLQDIIRELANPGLDPRQDFDEAGFKSDILTLDDLEPGMELTGAVRNIVAFGAFVDIGLKNDGLIHTSQMGKGYVSNVFDVLSVGQQVKVRVVSVDKERKRVGLGLI